jgi:hypothetical protein
MTMGNLLTRKKVLVMLAIAGVLGGIAWWQHKPLLARYYTQRLTQADEASREVWVARLVALDEAAVPSLLASLDNANRAIADDVALALVGLLRTWGPEDARSQAILEKAAAKVEALGVSKLHMAAALLEQAPQQWLEPCRGFALKGLRAADADTRVAAIQLVLRQPLRQDLDVLTKVVPLLKDSAAPVRKSALLALGPARELVSDDDLLPLLHDRDDDVQNLCELALRSRGLPENHILLARLISDERPSARLQVLQHLPAATDLEPGVWLRRLCLDPAPAVRAAAVRAAVSQSQADLRDCLDEIAQQDPSPTVRQLAGHYLTRYRPRSE